MVASSSSTATASATAKTAQLLTSYDATIALLEDEIAACSRGDEVFLQLYLLEGGSSSEAVLASLEAAGAERGVRVTFVLDVSYVSMLSRLTEKTTTLIPRVEQLATEQPQWCSCTYGSKPDHSKYALFLRAEPGASSAMLGGMNLGDRFRDWRDFVVRLPSPYAEQLQSSLGLDVASAASSSVLPIVGGGSGAREREEEAAAVSWTVKARAEALAITTPATAAAIFVSLGTLALSAPLATAAVAAATSPVAVSALFYAAVVAVAGSAATLGGVSPVTAAMSSLYAALSAAPLAVAAALLTASATTADAAAAAASPEAAAAAIAVAFASAAFTALAFSVGLGALSSAGTVYDFSLTRELGGLIRAAVYDRSALGDALAPLRPARPPPGRPFVPAAAPTPPSSSASSSSAAASTVTTSAAVELAVAESRDAEGRDTEEEPPIARRYLPATPPSDAPVRFVANRRALDRYEVRPRALHSGPAPHPSR